VFGSSIGISQFQGIFVRKSVLLFSLAPHIELGLEHFSQSMNVYFTLAADGSLPSLFT